MVVQALEFKDFAIKKMNRASISVENKITGQEFYMARRIFNQCLEHPETPLFIAHREWNGLQTTWLAAAMTY